MLSDDEIVEAMARGIDPQAWADDLPIPTRAHTIAFHIGRAKSIAQAQATLAARRAMGPVLVPAEPTKAMLKAARNAPIPPMHLDSIAARQDLEFLSRYRAMIAAAQGEMK
jgi:N-glycosylase/DNA lyase